MRVTHTGIKPTQNFELFSPIAALAEPLGLRTDSLEDRNAWMDSNPEWSPFPVLPRETVVQNLVFQGDAWQRPVDYPLELVLQMHTKGAAEWKDVERWTIHLDEDDWPHLAGGSPYPGVTDSRPHHGSRVHPSDLANRLARRPPRTERSSPGDREAAE
jgi:hypothetical protein